MYTHDPANIYDDDKVYNTHEPINNSEVELQNKNDPLKEDTG